MHSDLQPLAPFSGGNALLAVVSSGTLHVGCVLSGVLGALAGVTAFIRRRATD